jgi:serine/threonine protein kinase
VTRQHFRFSVSARHLNTMSAAPAAGDRPAPQVQPCRYKVGKVLGAGSYSVVKECIHIDTGRYYAAKVINKRLMAGREHMVRLSGLGRCVLISI